MPNLAVFLRIDLARARQQAEVLDGRIEERSEITQWTQMPIGLDTGIQVQVKSLFYRLSNEVDQRSIVAAMPLLEGLDITRAPVSEDQCWGIALLNEHQIQEQASHPPIAILEGMQCFKIVMGYGRAGHRVQAQCLATLEPAYPLVQIEQNI